MTANLVKLTREEWDAQTPRFRDHNYRQAWAYGERAAQRVGAVSEHVGLMVDGAAAALADVRVKALPVVGGGVAYVNGGPLVRACEPAPGDMPMQSHGQATAERFGAMLRALRTEYVQGRGMILRVSMPLGDPEWNAAQEAGLREEGFAESATADLYRTIAMRVDRPLDELRAGLAQKWRNCLNNSERQGVRVVESTEPAAMRRFAELYREFAARKGLAVNHDADFYAGVQDDLSEGDRLLVQLAEKDSEVVAGHVSSVTGDVCVYLLGATSPAGLAAKAAYLLQWSTVRLAHERGMRRYDLGGIDAEGNPGVHHFKSGMGGEERAVRTLECRPRGLRGRMAVSSERLYRRLRTGRRPRQHAATR